MAHHDHHAHDLTDANLGGSVAAGPARAMLGIGAALVAAGAWLGYRSGDPSHFARHWLVAMMLGLAICLGAMFFVVVQHLTRAGWSGRRSRAGRGWRCRSRRGCCTGAE